MSESSPSSPAECFPVFLSGVPPAQDSEEGGQEGTVRDCLREADDTGRSQDDSESEVVSLTLGMKRVSADSSRATLEFSTGEQACRVAKRLDGFYFRGSTISASTSEPNDSPGDSTSSPTAGLVSHAVILYDLPSSMAHQEDLQLLEKSLAALGLSPSADVTTATSEDDSATTEITLSYSSREQAEAAVTRLEGCELEVAPELRVKVRARMSQEEKQQQQQQQQQSSSSSPQSSNPPTAQRTPRKNVPAQHGYGGPQYYNHHHHNQPPAAPMGVGMGGPGGPGGPGSGGSRGGVIDFPLRILVQSDMVGAIIGRGGQTIRQITQQTRARVDVHRKESVGSTEKAITIYGQPENCTNACNRILRVIEDEAKNTGKPQQEVSLKILAHNNLIGRIIGKQGATIKRVMEETGTRIAVSPVGEVTSFNPERTISIVAPAGEVDAVSRAEADVSARLRAAYESDVHSMAPQSIMFPGLHPATMMNAPAGVAVPAPAVHHAYHPPHQQPHLMNGGRMQQQQQQHQLNPFQQQHNHHPTQQQHQPHHRMFDPFQQHQQQQHQQHHHQQVAAAAAVAAAATGGQTETVHLFVPNGSVGALIGSKGGHIRNVIKSSGANVKIAQTDEQSRKKRPEECEESKDENAQDEAATEGSTTSSALEPPLDERRVTITGNPESQWKAQYLIFEKLREEGFFSRHHYHQGGGGGDGSGGPASQSSGGEVRLTAEILVPASQVGRIIGKGGANVRELQRATGAAIKLPEQGSVSGDETPVHITGAFYSVQSAQRRLRTMILTSAQHQQQQQQQQQSGSKTVSPTETENKKLEKKTEEEEEGTAAPAEPPAEVSADDNHDESPPAEATSETLKLEDSSEC